MVRMHGDPPAPDTAGFLSLDRVIALQGASRRSLTDDNLSKVFVGHHAIPKLGEA